MSEGTTDNVRELVSTIAERRDRNTSFTEQLRGVVEAKHALTEVQDALRDPREETDAGGGGSFTDAATEEITREALRHFMSNAFAGRRGKPRKQTRRKLGSRVIDISDAIPKAGNSKKN
jgi:hypothetical protein